jgi:hypothetical protein
MMFAERGNERLELDARRCRAERSSARSRKGGRRPSLGAFRIHQFSVCFT